MVQDASDGEGDKEGPRFTRADLINLTVIAAMICIVFWKVILHPSEMLYSADSDIVEQFHPWHLLAKESMASGEIPFWNPYNFAGEPLLSNMQLGFYYPLNILFFGLFPSASAFGFSIMLHLFIASGGVYLLGRRFGLDGKCSLLPAVILPFSGYFMGHVYAGHYGQLCSASWIPLILLLFERSVSKRSFAWGAGAGALVGIQFLAGHIQMVIFSAFVMLVFYIHHNLPLVRKLRENWASFLAPVPGGLIAIGLSLVQMVPSIIFTDRSTRSGGVSYEFASSYSLPPWNFLSILGPYLFGSPIEDTYWSMWNWWEMSFFMGIPTLVLVLLSFRLRKDRNVRFLMVLGAVSLVMALGRFVPSYWLFWKLVPGFNILRVPSRFVVLFILSSSLLAGFGLRELMTVIGREGVSRRLSRGISYIASAPAIMALAMIVVKGPVLDLAIDLAPKISGETGGLDLPSLAGSAFGSAAMDLALLSAFLVATSVVIVVGARKGKRYVPLALTLLVFLNLGIAHGRLVDTRDPDEVYIMPEHVQYISQRIGDGRLYDPDETIVDNFQIVWGIRTVKGYNPLELRYTHDLISCIHPLSNNTNHPILDLLSVRFIISMEGLIGSGFEQVQVGAVQVNGNPNALPRSFIVHGGVAMDDGSALEKMMEGDFDPRAGVIVPKLPDGYIGQAEGYGGDPDPVIKDLALGEMEIRATLSEPGFLVLSESYYSEWDVMVDGVDAELLRAYHALMAV